MAIRSMDWRRYRALPPEKRRLLKEALVQLFMGRAAIE